MNVSELKTMRDINDYCIRVGVPSLAQGMIELPPPQTLRELAAKSIVEDSIHTYRNRFGEPEYREAVKKLLAEDYSTQVSVDNILACQGVSGGIVSTMALVADRGGSRVGIIEPFYTYHIFQIQIIFGKKANITYVQSKDHTTGFAPDWEKIEASIPNLDILVLCNPGNPTGRVWRKDELKKIVELTKKHNCILLLDECYSDMVWKPNVFYSPSQDGLEDHVVIVRGFSKVMGCQSWRVGYTLSSAKTVTELMRVMDPIYICTPLLQHSLGRFLSGHLNEFKQHKEKNGKLMQDNWNKLSEALKKTLGWEPIQPEGSMYGMFVHKSSTDMEAVKIALEKGVGVCPGSMFFANFPSNTQYTRIHCGVSEEKCQKIIEALTK